MSLESSACRRSSATGSRRSNGAETHDAQKPSVASGHENGITPRKLSSPLRSSSPEKSGVPETIQRACAESASHVRASRVVLERTSCISSSTTRSQCTSRRRASSSTVR